MRQTGLVLGIRIRIVEMVMMIMEIRLRHLIGKLAAGKRSLFQAGIHTGLVQSQRIE